MCRRVGAAVRQRGGPCLRMAEGARREMCSERAARRIQLHSAAFPFLHCVSPLAFTRCSEYTAQDRLLALRLAYSARRHAPPPPPPPHPPGGVAEGGGGGGAGGGGLGGLAGWVGQSVESFGSWYGGEVLQCPPAVELCALDADIWPVLTEVWPARGTWRGGAAVRLRGEHSRLPHHGLAVVRIRG